MSILGNPPWYFSTTRKYITMFGRIFSHIQITRTLSDDRTQLITVPLTYAAKEKMMTRMISDPAIDRQTAIILPVMSFEMTGLRYDGNRKLPTVNRYAVIDTTDKNKLQYQYNPVPYNLDMKLYVYVKNNEDGTKIVEQILPFFTPDWTLTANLVPELNIKPDIPIILNNVSFDDTYSGDFKERRAIIWTLDFTLKGYFYGPVRKSAIIKFANTNFYIPTTNTAAQGVGITGVAERVTIQPGLTSNGQPTSNVSLTVPYANIEVDDDYGFVEVITNLISEEDIT
jgi:hypothetical protein